MKSLKLTIAVGLLALAGIASANDIYTDAGAISSSISAPYSTVLLHDVGAFKDTFDFSIPTGSLGSSANPLYSAIFGVKTFDITGLTYSIYGGTSPVDTVFYGTFAGDNTTHDLYLLSGAYHIYVTGIADGTKGGSYALNLVSGVPEPETYAMMFAGLGLLGFTVHKQRKNTNV